MAIFASAFLIGIIAGLRALTAPAVVSWAAGLGWLPLAGTPLAFLGRPVARYILSFLALGELINDKLPKTPSRKVPPQFIARIVMGGFSGAAIGASKGSLLAGLLAGAIGAVVGTLGGAEFRGRLVKAIGGKDLPIALLEDVIAVLGGFFIVSHL
ncbi:MAG TPA: DUF4126 family protein [Edaphobacter sp.]